MVLALHNLTLGVTWVGSLLATPLPIGVKKNLRITLGPKELEEQTHFNIYILVRKCLCLGITAKHLDQKGRNSVYTFLEPR